MAISKISFRSVEAPKEQAKAKIETKIENEAPEVDEKMSTAAKLMIGASAVAGVVALGIAGYKGKLGKGVQKMLGGAEKDADDFADNVRKPKGESQNVKTPKAPALKPVEEIDGSDFSKLEGEFDNHGNKVIKDADGNVVREFYPSKDGKTLDSITDYDPNTGNHIKATRFREDGKTLDWIHDFDPNTGNPIKLTYFRDDGKTLHWVTDYDPNTSNPIKLTSFRKDGKKVHYVIEFDPKTADKEIQTTYYKEDGTVDRIVPAK